jgi:Ser/Thr protein kinase RdoA (MazF antagonist)
MSQQLSGMEIIADVVRKHYDLGNVELPQAVPDAHQRRHRKMIVPTDAGRFLVKTYKRDPVVLDALRFQHHLSDHLARKDLPVARIQRAKNGKGIVELDTWAMELQEFVAGEPMVVNGETLTVSAKALGRFHRVCREVPVPPRDARMWRFSEVPRTPFGVLFQMAQQERPGQEVVDQCNVIALFLHEAAQELAMVKRSEFETGLIHGDWHGGNLLFEGNRLMAILDLEFAGDGCYLEDIAYAISNLCVRNTVDTNMLTARVHVLLDNYQLSRSLSFAEEVALYYAVGVKHVTTVSYQSKQQGKVAGLTAAQWMEILAAQCTWLAQQAHKVRWGK